MFISVTVIEKVILLLPTIVLIINILLSTANASEIIDNNTHFVYTVAYSMFLLTLILTFTLLFHFVYPQIYAIHS